MDRKTKTRKYYSYVGLFFEGLARARTRTCSKWLHIHKNGTPAYKQRYDFVGNFTKGSALARDGKQYFRIRPDGTKIRQNP